MTEFWAQRDYVHINILLVFTVFLVLTENQDPKRKKKKDKDCENQFWINCF